MCKGEEGGEGGEGLSIVCLFVCLSVCLFRHALSSMCLLSADQEVMVRINFNESF